MEKSHCATEVIWIFFKKAIKQYITIRKSITVNLYTSSKLYATLEEAIKRLESLDAAGVFSLTFRNFIKECLQEMLQANLVY